MLRTSLPTNWSQIFEKIPSLLVIMFHKEWDGREGGMAEKGGGSQTSVTGTISEINRSGGQEAPQQCINDAIPSYIFCLVTQANLITSLATGIVSFMGCGITWICQRHHEK